MATFGQIDRREDQKRTAKGRGKMDVRRISGRLTSTYGTCGTEQQGEGNRCRPTREGSSKKVQREIRRCVTDKVMHRAAEFLLQIHNGERDGEKSIA